MARDQFRRSASGPIISTLLGVYDALGGLIQSNSLIVKGAKVSEQSETPSQPGGVLVDTGSINLREYESLVSSSGDWTEALVAGEAAALAEGAALRFPPKETAYQVNTSHVQAVPWEVDEGAQVNVGAAATLTVAKGIVAEPGQKVFDAVAGTLTWTDTSPIWANWFHGDEMGAQLSNAHASCSWGVNDVGPSVVGIEGDVEATTTAILTKNLRGCEYRTTGALTSRVPNTSDNDAPAIDLTGSRRATGFLRIVGAEGDGGRYPTCAILQARDETNLNGTVPASSGEHRLALDITGVFELGGIINVGSEANRYDGRIILTAAGGYGLSRFGGFYAGKMNTPKVKSADPNSIAGNGDSQGTTSTVADLALSGSSGKSANITSAGGNLPTVVAGQVVELSGCTSPTNDGRWVVNTVTTPGSAWAATKEYGANAVNDGASSVDATPRPTTVTLTTATQLNIGDLAVWATDATAGADTLNGNDVAGAIYLDGFSNVTATKIEALTGNDSDAAHVVIDCSRFTLNKVNLGSLYTHGATGGAAKPDSSIRIVGRPDDGDVSDYIVSGLIWRSTVMNANDDAMFIARVAVAYSDIVYPGALDVTCNFYARVTDIDWHLSTSTPPKVTPGTQLRGRIHGGWIDKWAGTASGVQGLEHLSSVGQYRWYGQGNRLTRSVDQSGYEHGLDLTPGFDDMPDADITVTLAEGSSRVLRQQISANRQYTVSTAGAAAGDVWELIAVLLPGGRTLDIISGGAGTPTVRQLTAASRIQLQYDGTNWQEIDFRPLTPITFQVERLVDGDCEAVGVADWTVFNNATLSKSAASPHGGAQALRVAYNTTAQPAARQDVLTNTRRYTITGWARGDGTVVPRVFTNIQGVLWTGTSSTAWQQFSVDVTADGDSFILYQMLGSSGWVEFDTMSVLEQSL